MWYFCHLYHIAIEFPLPRLKKLLNTLHEATISPKKNLMDHSHQHLKHFFTWFRLILIWIQWLETYEKYNKTFPDPHIIIIFYRPYSYVNEFIVYFPYTKIYSYQRHQLSRHVYERPNEYREKNFKEQYVSITGDSL